MRSQDASKLRPVFARADGRVLDLPGVEAATANGSVERADPRDFIPMPGGSVLLTLPQRWVVAFENGKAKRIDRCGGSAASAVAAALPLGYTRLSLPAYAEDEKALRLPLYGYTAVAWGQTGFCVAAARTDRLESWSEEAHSPERVARGIALRSQEFAGNPMLAQLTRCATAYRCFTAQNVFLRSGEAALPVSPACNARCLGCISEQDAASGVSAAQERIRTRPSPEHVAEVAIAHLEGVPDGIVSFGQGCEGEPLLADSLIEAALVRIRAATGSGVIHCNTNASRPEVLRRLIDAGLQSVRVSLNSARPAVYEAYYRPKSYSFADVVESIAVATRRGIPVSLNLLTHPGVTDDEDEMRAFARLLRRFPIGMVQTRTLNVDPLWYLGSVGSLQARTTGMRCWLAWMRDQFPKVRVGNFTRGFG